MIELNNGWIKLHRTIKKHWVFDSPEYLRAWILVLLEVNHEDKKVCINSELIECKRGQSLNSIGTWVSLLGKGWTPMKMRTFIKLLKNDSMINYEGLHKTSRLTVCNFETYQNAEHTDNTQTTHKQQTDNKQITTNKNEQEVKEKNICVKKSKDKNLVVDTENIVWKRSTQISISGNDREYLSRVDWWYKNAKEDEGWKKDIKEIYPEVDYISAFKSMRQWLLTSKKSRRNDLNRTFRLFCCNKEKKRKS